MVRLFQMVILGVFLEVRYLGRCVLLPQPVPVSTAPQLFLGLWKIGSVGTWLTENSGSTD